MIVRVPDWQTTRCSSVHRDIIQESLVSTRQLSTDCGLRERSSGAVDDVRLNLLYNTSASSVHQ